VPLERNKLIHDSRRHRQVRLEGRARHSGYITGSMVSPKVMLLNPQSLTKDVPRPLHS